MKESPLAGKGPLFPVWLLRSKVSPTRQRVDLLERPSLTLKLHRALDASLSLIHAPAGFGKSTLLANWRRVLLDEGHTVCWLSLGRQDNDRTQLLTYIAFALAEGGVRFDAAGAGVDVSPGELSEREFLSLIIHFIAEHERRVVLMLDDFENLDAPAAEAIIQPLIGYAPENLHLAIATRDDSPLRITSLEAKGQAVRFGAAQLRFTPMELNDFLADELSAPIVQKLYRMTEGWPVAIQMIRRAVQDEGDVDRIMGDLTGDVGQIAGYLSEEVLSQLDPRLQEFLMDIALVDRIDVALADRLRDRDDSLAWFGEARALDTLVLPLDSLESTFRLHPLFREHLYERLRTTRLDRARALHLRAADWFAERGDLVESVRHCVQAGAQAHAADIVDGFGGVMLWFKEGLSRLRAIMRLLDDEAVLNDWRLAMIRCLLYIKDGEVHRARLLYDAVTARTGIEFDDLTQLGASSRIHEFAVMEIVISIYEGKPISHAYCRQLEARIDALDEREHAIRSNLLTFLCVGYLQRGEFREARRAGERAIPAFTASGSLYGTAYIYFHLGDISFAKGDSAEAARFYQQGLDIARKHFNDDQGMKLVANILIAELNYELDDVGAIPAIARSVPRLLERHEAWFDIYAAGYATSARREFDDYGIDAALAIVDRAEDYAERNHLFRLTKMLACLRMELLLRAGRVADARTVLLQSGIDIADYRAAAESQIAWRERDAAVVAITRLLIAEGDHAGALALLARFSQQARSTGDIRARMRLHLLLAIAHERTADRRERNRHLEAALALFGRARYLRPFLDLRDEVQMLLAHASNEADAPDCVAHRDQARFILERLGDRGEPGCEAPLLSPRENQVLQELVQGYSNKVIARKIDVSESTVRFHLRNIFAKLNVTSRLQAVAVASQQKLV